MQNFVGRLVVDSIGVGLAAFGFLNPLLARLHSRLIRDGFRLEFREIAPASLTGESVCSWDSFAITFCSE